VEDSPSFHVVAPSIPGFGFSDASLEERFGLKETATLFHNLMRKLGYDRYVIYASNWYAYIIPIYNPTSL
jgi:pimeloyl-ACP methyl ester carboxylesterase